MSTQLPPGQKLCTCSHTCGINGVPRPERTYFHHQAKAKKLLIQARAAQVSSLTNDTTPSSPIPSGHRYTQGHGKSGSESDSDSSDSSESSSGHYSDSRVDSPMDQDGPGMQSVHDPHGDMNNSQSPDFGGESNSDSVSSCSSWTLQYS
jgi:cobalamin biosynthesis Mg chelatase CobN